MRDTPPGLNGRSATSPPDDNNAGDVLIETGWMDETDADDRDFLPAESGEDDDLMDEDYDDGDFHGKYTPRRHRIGGCCD